MPAIPLIVGGASARGNNPLMKVLQPIDLAHHTKRAPRAVPASSEPQFEIGSAPHNGKRMPAAPMPLTNRSAVPIGSATLRQKVEAAGFSDEASTAFVATQKGHCRRGGEKNRRDAGEQRRGEDILPKSFSIQGKKIRTPSSISETDPSHEGSLLFFDLYKLFGHKLM